MENPPPGYNPNVSLLSGGTGTILPVQGGGGGDVPANYNPNQSLLEGGTGTIQAIRGGGDAKQKKVTFANQVKNKKNAAAVPAPVSAAPPAPAAPAKSLLRFASPRSSAAPAPVAAAPAPAPAPDDSINLLGFDAFPVGPAAPAPAPADEKERPMTQREIKKQAEENAAAATAAAAAPAPAPAPAPEPSPAPSPPPADSFQVSTDAKDKEKLFEFSIELKKYRIRFATDDVKENWKQQIFIQDEVDFLNALHLSPKLLHTVFQEEWRNKLALFLQSLVDSKCFQDTSLLINVNCKDARSFLQKVHMQLYTNELEDFYNTRGLESPQKDKQNVLGGIIGKLKKINLVSAGPQLIRQNDFRGNASGRYLDFHINTKESDLPWFVNYVEKEKNASGKEKTFYKRLYGKNPEDILQKYRQIKKGPPAPPGPPPSAGPGSPPPGSPPSAGPGSPPAGSPPSAGPLVPSPPPFKSKLPPKNFTNFKKPSEAYDYLDSLLSEVEDHIEPKPPAKPIAEQMKNKLSLTRKRITNRLALSRERIGNRLAEIQDRLSKIKLPTLKKGGKQTKYRLTRKRFVHKI